MKTTDNFRADLLLKNVAAALREGYISNENALYLIGVAAGRIDAAALTGMVKNSRNCKNHGRLDRNT